MTNLIEVQNLSKLYRRMAPGFKLRTLKSALLERSLVDGLRPSETVAALEDISFTVGRGEALGVVGSNGSGKSTLLKVVAGILKPTKGLVRVDGRVAALIELGAGFHPEISGRENVFINGAVLGLTRREITRRYDEIVEFSGLDDFMEEPVKNYSSGMYVRLGFAVAIHTNPQVLLVDEVLAVGDEAFAHRCLRRMEEFLAQGGTLLLVSHSLDLIARYSDRALWLDRGSPRLLGSPRRVVDAYRQAVAEAEGREHFQAKEERGHEVATQPKRWGSGVAQIAGVRLLDGSGAERYHFESGETVVFEFDVEASDRLEDFVFGVAIKTPRGADCWGTNTYLEGFEGEAFEGCTTVRVSCPSLRLGAGEYLVDVAVHAKNGAPYDYQKEVLSFSMTAAQSGIGVYLPQHQWKFSGSVEWRSLPKEVAHGRDQAGP